MPVLELNRIKSLYGTFKKISPWKDWHSSYLSDVRYFKSLTDQDFLNPSNQEKLWRARGISGIGPGEAVNVRGAYSDPNIANTLLRLQKNSWPEDPHKRAKAFGDAYDQIMDLVYGPHSTQRPQAKLARLLTALLPEDLHTCYQWQARKHVQEMVLGKTDFSFCEGAVLLRTRLREVLGKEANLEEHVWRSMFCWWLHENYAVIQRGEDPVSTSVEEPSLFAVIDRNEQPSVELLKLWPLTKQRRGFPAIASYLESFRMLVTAARGGASPEDLVETIKATPEFVQYSPSSCRQLFNLVRNLGFLENKNGLWYPSEEGEALVEDDPADILVEKFFVQVFGFAHLVQKVDSQAEITRKQLYKYLREIYPRWTSDFMPSAILAWLKSLGIILTEQNGVIRLSDYGKDWAKRLPSKLLTPAELGLLEDQEIELVEESSIAEPFVELSASDIWAAFTQDPDLRGFVFSERQVESLHLALHCNPRKRFVILSGLSGTGKTALLCHYSRIYCNLKGLDLQEHQAIVAVSPDWRDPSGLLGYLNALHSDPTFQIETALRLVISAANNPHLPYFLILDEMNLARVERYFAPFLSSMETGEALVLHAHDDSVNGVPPKISWPANLFVGGTVNMDETTHPFSDKVLDRAFTMEFWDVRLEDFFERRATINGNARRKKLEKLLLELNLQLNQIRRHFGYRTAGEILDFVDKADGPLYEDQPRYSELVDQAIFSKILPRIRGEEAPVLVGTLKKIEELCNQNELKMCVQKISGMNDRLKATGVTRFWS